jgi:uncharacterized protein (DUF849 family)
MFLRKGQPASSERRMQKMARLATELDREIATPAEMRALLGRKGRDKITFLKPEAVWVRMKSS